VPNKEDQERRAMLGWGAFWLFTEQNSQICHVAIQDSESSCLKPRSRLIEYLHHSQHWRSVFTESQRIDLLLDERLVAWQ